MWTPVTGSRLWSLWSDGDLEYARNGRNVWWNALSVTIRIIFRTFAVVSTDTYTHTQYTSRETEETTGQVIEA